MRNKDSGEFELVVGDKQLLSGFFIGIVLLAVVFAMGYVLGRSSPKSASVVTDTGAVTPNTVAENRPQPASPAQPAGNEAASPAAATPESSAPPAEARPQPTTVPARDPAAAAPAPPPAPPPAADPANASYWQVTAASSKNSAEAVSQTLLSKGFPASSRPGPNNLTVVWVGPYTDKESLARAKKQLEDAGFNQIIKKPQ